MLVCGGESVETGASTPSLGACAGGLRYTVIQGSRQPEPLHLVTVSLSESHLGLPWLHVSLSRLQGGSRRIGSALGHVACVSFQPRSTPFSQNSLLHSVHLFFLFCLLFNLYLDSFETLQSDLTLELSVAGAPHATGGCPKAPGAVLPGSPCTSVSPPAP